MKSIHPGQKATGRSVQKVKSQGGNILFLILIAIVLFAALTFAFSRGGRTNKVSLEDSQFYAQQILSFAEKVNSGVQSVAFHNGCLTSQISFENTTVAGYTNAASPANKKCFVFDRAGGVAKYEAPPVGAQDLAAAAAAAAVPIATGSLTGQYLFTGKICVDGVGTGALASCATDAASNEELMLILPWVSYDVCITINRILGNSAAMLQQSTASFDTTKFTGTFADGYALGAAGFTTYQSGCYQSTTVGLTTPGPGYHFYYTLLSR